MNPLSTSSSLPKLTIRLLLTRSSLPRNLPLGTHLFKASLYLDFPIVPISVQSMRVFKANCSILARVLLLREFHRVLVRSKILLGLSKLYFSHFNCACVQNQVVDRLLTRCVETPKAPKGKDSYRVQRTQESTFSLARPPSL